MDGETGRSRNRSSLLINEPPLQVLPSLAELIGVEPALLLQQIHYWLIQPGAHARDGRRWIYNSYPQWQEQLPFWSIDQIGRIVRKLEKDGLLLTTAAYNRERFDKRKWYTIDYNALETLTARADLQDRHAKSHDDPANLHGETAKMQDRHAISHLVNKEQRLQTETIDRDQSNSKSTTISTLHNEEPDASWLMRALRDFARELGDEAPFAATLARAANLWERSGLGPEAFIGLMYEARRRTQRHTATIEKRRSPRSATGIPFKNKMPYFFSVLEDLFASGSAPKVTSDGRAKEAENAS